jgi:hypothetical protein
MAGVGAYSPDTDTHYDNWDALVEAESNGYVVVAIVSNGKVSWPWVVGPYDDKLQADRARARLRRKLKREQDRFPSHTFSLYVRPAWKDGHGSA